MTTATEAKLEYLKNTVERMESKMDSRDDKIYHRINNVASELGAVIDRNRMAWEARLTRHIDSGNNESKDVATKIERLSTLIESHLSDDKKTEGEVTAVVNIARLEEKHNQLKEKIDRAKRIQKQTDPPLLDAKRFLKSPWLKIIGSILALVLGAFGVDASGLIGE